jgi:hypothetical protein
VQVPGRGPSAIGHIDCPQFVASRTEGGWTSLKGAELSSSVFPGFRRVLRAPLSVTGDPAMFLGGLDVVLKWIFEVDSLKCIDGVFTSSNERNTEKG